MLAKGTYESVVLNLRLLQIYTGEGYDSAMAEVHGSRKASKISGILLG